MQSDVLTRVLAIWGAFLSSVGLGWNLYRDLIDRARLKPEAYVRRIVQAGGSGWYAARPDLELEGASEKVFVVMNVINRGRRQIVWQGWGGKHHKRPGLKEGFVIIPRNLPKLLRDGETHSDFTDALISRIEDVKELFVWDATGKKWHITKRNFRELIADCRKYRTQA